MITRNLSHQHAVVVMGLLRTLFAITVVFAHSPLNGGFVFVGGRNAVQLFYMISGFLISYIISTNRAYRNPYRFYLNRALRLYPIYLVVALLALLGVVFAKPKFFELYAQIPIAADMLLLFSNLFLIGQDWVMFAGIDNGQLVFAPDFTRSDVLLFEGLLVPQAWTLGVEISFYLIAPCILHKRRLVILLLLLSLLIRLLLITLGVGGNDPWTYRFFPAELALFLLGVLAEQYLLPWWKGVIATNNLPWLPSVATFALVALALGFTLLPFTQVVSSLLLFLVFFLLLPLTFLYQNNSPTDRAVGELSYPLYVGHLLVISSLGTGLV